MKKLILMSLCSAIAISAANAAGEVVDTTVTTDTVQTEDTNYFNPLNRKVKAIEFGGDKDIASAYQDGIGVYVAGAAEETKIDNKEYNKLALKYGEKAKEAGVTLDKYLLKEIGEDLPEEDKKAAEKLRDTVDRIYTKNAECEEGFRLGENGVCVAGELVVTPVKCDIGAELVDGECRKVNIDYINKSIREVVSYINATATSVTTTYNASSYSERTCPTGYSKTYWFKYINSYWACSDNSASYWWFQNYKPAIYVTKYKCNIGDTLSGTKCYHKTTKYTCSKGTLSGTKCKIVNKIAYCPTGTVDVGDKCEVKTTEVKTPECTEGSLSYDEATNTVKCVLDTRVEKTVTCPPMTYFDAETNKCKYNF